MPRSCQPTRGAAGSGAEAPLSEAQRTFKIGPCLGRGGFGEVYRAVMRSPGGIDTEVALKVLRQDVAAAGQALSRLKDEGRLLSALQHPAILRVYDLIVLAGRICLVTEYVDGQDLSRCTRGEDRLPLRGLIEVIGQVASALDAAFHAPLPGTREPVKIVHRDIKPSNIRIGRTGEVKLLDFGIARTDELTREAVTGTDVLVGSPPYMAPERFLDDEPRSASDVFALGVTLWEGIAGQRMFSMPVTVQATHAVDPRRYEIFTADRLAELTGRVPPEVIELLESLVAFDPEQRPTAAALARRCDALIDVIEGPTLGRWARHRTWPPPRRLPGALEGRTLEEGSPDISGIDTELRQAEQAPDPTVDLPTPSSSGHVTRVGLVLGGVSATLLTGAGLGLVLLSGLLVWIGAQQGGADTPPVLAAPAPRPEPEPTQAQPAPEPTQPQPTQPQPQPQPTQPQPTPARPAPAAPARPAPRVAPRRAEPQPQAPRILLPEELPSPSVGATARVRSSGDAPVTLVSGTHRLQLPADVPEGVWRIHVQWPDAPDPVADRQITITAGNDYLIRCTARMRTCSSDAAP